VTDLFRYDADSVAIDGHDLPGLKGRFLLEHLPDGAVVLDVGCGSGKMLRTISRYRPAAVLLGCDIRVPTESCNDFEFRRVDPMDGRLPYDDGVVDVALLFDVLEHVTDPADLLREVERVVRPGGSLLAFVPIEGEPVSWYHLFRWLFGQDLYLKTKDHLQAFSHSEVEALVSACFELQQRRYAYHLVGQLMDAGFCALLAFPSISHRFWTESPYHNRSRGPRSLGSRLFATTLVAANAVAWGESTLLAGVRLCSGGVLLEARRPDNGFSSFRCERTASASSPR
jgi:SAM-dependent methyltransferase